MENVHRTLLPSIILLGLGGIQAERGSKFNGALVKVWPTSQNSLKDALPTSYIFFFLFYSKFLIKKVNTYFKIIFLRVQ